MTIGYRITELRKHLQMTQQEMADALGMSRSTFSKYEADISTPSSAVFSLICKEFDVNEDWLRSGNGEMLRQRSRNEQIARWAGEIISLPDSEFKKRLVNALSMLDDDGWKRLEQFLDEIKAGV